MTKRRNVARLLAPVLAVWLAIMPYREARAVLPVAIPFVISGLNSAGGVAVADIVAAGVSALIGGTIVALGITPQSANAPTLRVPLTNTSASTSAISQPQTSETVPWTTSWGYWDYYIALTEASPQAAADKYCAWSMGNEASVCNFSTNTCSGGEYYDTCYLSHAMENRHCPMGSSPVEDEYGVVMQCTVTDARRVYADGNLDFWRNSGTQFQAYQDKDKEVQPALPYSFESDAFLTSGLDAQGRPLTVTVQALSTGGSLLITRTEMTDAQGQKYISRQVVQVAANGSVTTGSSVNTTGQGSYASSLSDGTASLYVILETGATSATGATGSGTGTGSGSVTFPSDYARQGEAAAGAGTITSAINALRGSLTETAPAPSDPTYSKDYTGFGDTFSGLLGWQLPAHASQCPTGTFSVFGASFTLDSHCGLMQSNEDTIRAAMMAAWSLLALFIVLRA